MEELINGDGSSIYNSQSDTETVSHHRVCMSVRLLKHRLNQNSILPRSAPEMEVPKENTAAPEMEVSEEYNADPQCSHSSSSRERYSSSRERYSSSRERYNSWERSRERRERSRERKDRIGFGSRKYHD
jgi:hypothetical protein